MTTSTSTRSCATCGEAFKPVGKARYCSEDCRHGTDAGYNAGCRCTRCRAAHARNHKRLRVRANPHLPGVGTHRRIQALACLGWSTADLSRRLGMHRSYLLKALRRPTLEPTTVHAVADLYEALCMTHSPAKTAARTAADARARSWVPPLAWDDIDDPDEQPTGWEYLPPSRREQLVELDSLGYSVSEVCRRLHLSEDALQKWCGNQGLSGVYRRLAAREHRAPNGYTKEQAA